jgi:hypothetical protein
MAARRISIEFTACQHNGYCHYMFWQYDASHKFVSAAAEKAKVKAKAKASALPLPPSKKP